MRLIRDSLVQRAILSKFKIFLLFLLVCLSCQKTESSYLSSLTQEERADIDYLFRHLLIEDSGAFVLFGSKPLCDSGFFDHAVEDPRYRRNLAHGWAAWEKLKKQLPTTRYLLVKKMVKIPLQYPDRYEEKTFQHIILANIEKTAFVLAENYELFKNYVGIDFHPLQVVFELEDPNSLFWNKVFDFEHPHRPGGSIAHGLLFGFGKRNALFWTWESDLAARNEKAAAYFKHAPFAFHSFQNKEGELQEVSELEIPAFKAIEGDETLKRYKREKREIEKLYRGKEFLEVTLKQLSK
ncbi:MAG: hypothetical protein KGJ02_02025 [Verrucomicrobiota bacterium]|nr:hypothetical protein [Verrucomicrobiota bacterium]